MNFRRSFKRLLLLSLVATGGLCFAICMYYALVDWDLLQRAYANFAKLTETSSDLPQLFIAEARQNIHRINLFADGVWALLGAVVAAIGIHGLCTTKHLS